MPSPPTLETIERRLEEFRAACRARGLSITPQRLEIYRALVARGDHPSPEMLYESVRERIPNLSLATVYKTVEMLTDLGLLQPVSPLHDRMRLDPNMEPHHHLVCVRCRAVVDVDAEAVETLRLPPAARQGFKVFGGTAHFSGLCPECQRA